jgi:hypothetical protein
MTKKPVEDEFDFEGDAADDAAPSLVTKRALSDLSGLPLKKIEALIRSGLPCVPGATSRAPIQFDIKKVFAWLVAGNATPPDPMDDIKRRKALVALRREERNDLKDAGALISKADTKIAIARGVARFRSTLLDIPERLTGQSAEVRQAVNAEIVGAFEQLERDFAEADFAEA